MTSIAFQLCSTRTIIVALLVLTLCFILVVYTLMHEAGHASVGAFFGQTPTALNVNFLTLSAPVELAGELTPVQ